MQLSLLKKHFFIGENSPFDNRSIFKLFFPIFIEQAMIIAMGYADTMMVAYVGETAVAGISLVATFNTLVRVMLSALAIGGCIVISQYVGKGESHNAGKAMKMTYYSVLALSSVLAVILLVFKVPFLHLISGNVEPEVFKNAKTYFIMSAYSYPLFSIYYVISAAFRAVGNSRLSMICSLIMMALNLIIKAVLIYGLNMGVLGAGISTFASTLIIAVMLTVLACRPAEKAYIKSLFKIKLDLNMIKTVLFIGIPNSIENGMFQLGILLLQRLTASFGTASIAANSILNNITMFPYLVNQCFGMVLVTVVGQCMGAGKSEQARFYTKHILKLTYSMSLIVSVLCIVFNRQLVGSFNLSAEVSSMASMIFYMYCLGSILYYPTSFVMPNALRASGDTKFTMISSISTMFGARIGLAYVFGACMNMGLFGIWLAMQADWIVRSIIFVSRFASGKWQNIKVV